MQDKITFILYVLYLAFLALAYSGQGQALLEGFNFFRIQNAAAMPDHVPLFGLELEAGFMLVHNHPCGDAEPSSADIKLTRRIGKGARILGLTFLDHVIVGQPIARRLGYYSLQAAGLL